MVGHGGSSAGSYLADPTSPIPAHCASIVVTSTVRVKGSNEFRVHQCGLFYCDEHDELHGELGNDDELLISHLIGASDSLGIIICINSLKC